MLELYNLVIVALEQIAANRVGLDETIVALKEAREKYTATVNPAQPGQPAQAETAQAETAQAETAQAETAQAETAQAETAQAETAQADITEGV